MHRVDQARDGLGEGLRATGAERDGWAVADLVSTGVVLGDSSERSKIERGLMLADEAAIDIADDRVVTAKWEGAWHGVRVS